MHNYLRSYPYLEQLLGGWFHQDFDLEGGDIETIIADYKQVSHAHDVMGLRADIKRLIHDTEANELVLEQVFIDLFKPDVMPEAWGMTTKDWLLQIYKIVSEED